MEVPNWVSGGQTNDGSIRKFNRALETLRKQNIDLKAQGHEPIEITEAAVKALYIKYNGKLVETEPEEVIEEKKRGKK